MMTLVYKVKLGVTTKKICIGALKINELPLETYNMIIIKFLLWDCLERELFFEETFLLPHTRIKFSPKYLFSFLVMQTSSLQR